MRAPLDVSPAQLASPASAPSHPGVHPGTADWLLLLGPGLIWGASFLFIAEGLRSVGPNGLTFARILVGFVVLGLVPGARRAIAREDRGRVVLLGLIWLALPLSMFPLAEQRVSSALTGMLNGANPLFVAIVVLYDVTRMRALESVSSGRRWVSERTPRGVGIEVSAILASEAEGNEVTAGFQRMEPRIGTSRCLRAIAGR